MASNQAQNKELVLIGDVNSSLAAQIAQRFNDLNYPVLTIGSDQNFLESIEYSNPGIVASIEGKIDDLDLLKEALQQVESVFGGLAKIVVTSGINRDIPDDRNKITLPDKDEFKQLVSSATYGKFFSTAYLKKISIISIANLIPKGSSGKEVDRDSDVGNSYLNNMKLININPIDKKQINLKNKVDLGDFFINDLIGRAPYDNQQIAILAEKMVNHLPASDSFNYVQVLMKDDQMSNVKVVASNTIAVEPEETKVVVESEVKEIPVVEEEKVATETPEPVAESVEEVDQLNVAEKIEKAKTKEPIKISSAVKAAKALESQVDADDEIDLSEQFAKAEFISKPKEFSLPIVAPTTTPSEPAKTKPRTTKTTRPATKAATAKTTKTAAAKKSTSTKTASTTKKPTATKTTTTRTRTTATKRAATAKKTTASKVSVTRKRTVPARKPEKIIFDETTKQNIERFPESVEKLNDTVRDFTQFVDKMSSTINNNQRRAAQANRRLK